MNVQSYSWKIPIGMTASDTSVPVPVSSTVRVGASPVGSPFEEPVLMEEETSHSVDAEILTSHLSEQPLLPVAIPVPSVADSTDVVVIPELLRPLQAKPVDSSKYALPQTKFVSHQKVVPVEKIDSLFRQMPQDICVVEDGRAAGDPLPFKMLEENGIVVGLLLCCFIAALITSNSLHYLQLSLKDFFSGRMRENMFDDSTDNRMPGRLFLSLAFCASVGVLLFFYQQAEWPELFYLAPPLVLLGIDIGGCCLVYMCRTLLFAFVNTVFFDREQNKKWMDAYRLLTVVASLLVLPLLLLVVFNEVDFVKWRIFLMVWLVLMEILLVFKTYRIFFEGALGVLHIILYLCSLEIIPLLSVWKGMVWVTQELTKLV